jgi:O-antigen/teichoic acid export membrane protein
MLKVALIRLAKGSFIYGIGSMLQRFMGLLLLPLFTRALSPQDYGVVALVSLIGVALGGVFNLGTGNSMGLLYYRETNISKRPSIIWTNVLLLMLNCSFWYSIVFLSAPLLSTLVFQSDRYADLIRLALLGSAFSTISEPWLSYLRMEENARHYVVITLVSSLLSIGLSIWFVLVQDIGVEGVVLAGTMTQGIMLAVGWLIVGRNLPFNIDSRLFRPLIKIGFPSIFGLFAFLFIDYADRQMIARMVSLDALGVYAVGYSFGMVMSIAMGAFATAWAPFFMSYRNKPDEARVIFSKVLTYYLIGFGLLTVLSFFAAKPAVYLLTASKYHEAHLVVGLVAAAYMLKGCYLIVLPGVYFAEKLHKQVIIEWAAAVINIGLNLWLIPIFGIVGAALATLFSYLSLPICAWLVARHYLVVDYDWGRLSKISITALLACALLYFLSAQVDVSLSLTVNVNIVVLLFFIGATYWLLITACERDELWGKLRS